MRQRWLCRVCLDHFLTRKLILAPPRPSCGWLTGRRIVTTIGEAKAMWGLDKQVPQWSIFNVGLKGKVKCSNKLSILTSDLGMFGLFEHLGDPIGVAGVKKPGNNHTLWNEITQGQLFDNSMLRLQSFFSLKHVFGFPSICKEWCVCQMPQSNGAVVPTRKMQGTEEV